METGKNDPETETWLTKTDVASRLKVSKRTVERLQAEGELKAYKVHNWLVRFKQSDILAYMEKHGIPHPEEHEHSENGNHKEEG